MKTNQLKEETTVSNINTRPKPEGTSKKSSILQVYCLEHFEGVYQILNIVFGGIKLLTYDSTDYMYIHYNLTCYEIWCHIIIIELTLLLFGTGCIGVE